MEAPKIKLPPCKKGTRRNKVTGNCEPIPIRLNELKTLTTPEAASKTTKITVKLPPCKKGTRRNKVTGNCDPIPIRINELKTLTTPASADASAPAPAMPELASAPAMPELESAPTPSKKKSTRKKTASAADADDMPAAAHAANEDDMPAAASVPAAADEVMSSVEDNEEEKEYAYWQEHPDEPNMLYPSLNDPLFNIKISGKQEFNDTQYDGKIHSDIEAHANKLCNADYDMSPHQLFVRNFLSFQTPYNSLLLYHGLGSGKTCSAIGVAEEMRDYIINMGMTSQIIIVASPNVQVNFRVQLFDERKLKLIDGLWNIRACTGNKFLKEINPMNMKGLSKENVIKQVNNIIDTYYYFFGYVAFANYIKRKGDLDQVNPNADRIKANKLRKVFDNRLIIIDEVQNIRTSEDNKNKIVAEALLELISFVGTLRLLLLSATPMYNSYKEIVWLLNLMHANDRRGKIKVKDIFKADGTFKEGGKELLERKATGYISFVRGENPYTFPYRIWPKEFAMDHTFSETKPYPALQMVGEKRLTQNINPDRLSLYLVDIGEIQQLGYNYIIKRLADTYMKHQEEMENEKNEAFGYTVLQIPIEALNIIYPDERLSTVEDNPNAIDPHELVGSEGLKRIMNFTRNESMNTRSKFTYNPETLEKYGKIFSLNEIGKYSSKIKNICECINTATGVILVYSQYIDAGLVPLALALEEMGYSRAGDVNALFATPPAPVRRGFNYILITGDKGFTPDAASDIKMATSDDNQDGQKVKVILISQTGAEGLDLKFIRQVHILEPWYNLNRIEQIIGRAVRTCSHKALPFMQRNVEIYLYASLNRETDAETTDLYVYRLAEKKAAKIGEVTRVLKESSIDCILNYEQTNFTEENMASKIKPVTIQLASEDETDVVNEPGKRKKKMLENYKIGDKPFSAICDYMESCDYTCRPDKNIADIPINTDTYNEDFIMMNTEKLIQKIKELFKNHKTGRFFYKKREIIDILVKYPKMQINAALQNLIENKNEYITDKYGRLGHLVNIDDLYIFQPIELKNVRSSIYERTNPIDVKHDKIVIKLTKGNKAAAPESAAHAPASHAPVSAVSAAPAPVSAAHAPVYVNKEMSELVKRIIIKYNKAIKRSLFDFKLLQGMPDETLTANAEIESLGITTDIIDIWHEGLEEANRLYTEREYTRLLILLEVLQKYLTQGRTAPELEFIKMFGKILNDAWNLCTEYKETKKIETLKTAWEKHYLNVYKSVFEKDKKEWYTSCKDAIEFMKDKTINMAPISENELTTLVVEHIVDELSLPEIILVLNQLSQDNPIFTKDIFVHVKKYIESQLLKSKKGVKGGIKGLLWRSKKVNVMIVKHVNEDWYLAVAKSPDEKDLEEKRTELKNKLTNFNDIIGFMNNKNKSEDVIVFKTKNMKLKETGSRCDQKGNKGISTNTLNAIVGGNEYPNILSPSQQSICIIQEFYLRLYQKMNRDGKTWFLTPAQAILIDIEKKISK